MPGACQLVVRGCRISDELVVCYQLSAVESLSDGLLSVLSAAENLPGGR